MFFGMLILVVGQALLAFPGMACAAVSVALLSLLAAPLAWTPSRGSVGGP
jgi:hypothetical protein